MKWLIAILLIPTIGWCQEKNDKTRFGFYVGTNMRSLSAELIAAPAIKNLEFSPRIGLQLGSMYKLETGVRNSFMTSMGLNFYEHQMRFDYTQANLPPVNQRVELLVISGQVSDRFSVLLGEKMDLYSVAGFSVNYVLDKEENTPTTNLLSIKPWSAYASAGVGIDLKHQYFTLSPELRYERSIGNLHEPTYSIASNSVSRLNSNTLFLTLIFS